MIWWIVLAVILTIMAFFGLVEKCEATFSCVNCGKSITIRTFASKQVMCKWCGKAHYTMFANGKRFMRIDYHVQALDDDRPARHGIIPGGEVSITTDTTEIQED